MRMMLEVICVLYWTHLAEHCSDYCLTSKYNMIIAQHAWYYWRKMGNFAMVGNCSGKEASNKKMAQLIRHTTCKHPYPQMMSS
jgi:hypothetical protein